MPASYSLTQYPQFRDEPCRMSCAFPIQLPDSHPIYSESSRDQKEYKTATALRSPGVVSLSQSPLLPSHQPVVTCALSTPTSPSAVGKGDQKKGGQTYPELEEEREGVVHYLRE